MSGQILSDPRGSHLDVRRPAVVAGALPEAADCARAVHMFDHPAWIKFADEHGLHNAKRKDSTGICFIGERRFADCIHQYLSRDPGRVTDPQGRVLGEHDGLHAFTIGQRQGLAIGGLKGRAEHAWYVAEKDSDSNHLIITQDSAILSSQWLRAAAPNWLEPVAWPLRSSSTSAVSCNSSLTPYRGTHPRSRVISSQFRCAHTANT